jgi:hypothetical protein
MAEKIFSPDKKSKDNIIQFINTISDTEIKNFLLENYEKIILLGSDKPDNNLKDEIFREIQKIVDLKLMGEKDEN